MLKVKSENRYLKIQLQLLSLRKRWRILVSPAVMR